ncbi:MAG: isoleucine biosynthesis transcriptional activator [Betaproteobacteria bacterium]|nr:MAG: isoleucine biosynthesis transcriptional activator [Betaproteobacteria bacterium]
MELRHLRYFVAVAETLHFGRAAARLHISQPPLSRQIRALEREVGTPLFERSARSVRLTPAGAALLPEARRLLREAEALAAGARDLARGAVGVLQLGFISASAYNVLPRVLPGFRRSRPGVRLVLAESTSDVQLGALAEGTLDAGILLPPVTHPALAYAALLREPLVAALPDARRWPARVPLGRLSREPFVLFPRHAGPGLHDVVVAACEREGFAPRVEQEAVQMPTIVSLVAAGMGVALVPASLQNMRRTGVVYRPLAGTAPRVEVGIAWRAADRSPVLAAFVAHARGAFEGRKD